MDIAKRKKEIIVITALILIAVVLVGVRIHLSSKVAKEDALIDQLKAVRSSVQLYLTLNRKMPDDLNVLTTEKYTIGNRRGLYLSGVTVDKENYPVDAFGKRFVYDAKTGNVRSGTEGYGQW